MSDEELASVIARTAELAAQKRRRKLPDRLPTVAEQRMNHRRWARAYSAATMMVWYAMRGQEPKKMLFPDEQSARDAFALAKKMLATLQKSTEIRARADAPDPDGLPTIPLPFIRPAGLYPLETDG